MKRIFIFAFIGNLVFSVGSFLVLPEQVAIHFGTGGHADGWSSREFHLLLNLGMDSFLFMLFFFIPKGIRRFPKSLMNLPDKSYWLQPENLQRLYQLMDDWLHELGVAMMIFLLVIGGLTLKANLAQPVRLNEPTFFVVLAIFMAYVLYWSWSLYVKLKPSKRSL